MQISPQRRLDAFLRTRYDAFLRKSFCTVDPGVDLEWNWHLQLMCETLEKVYRGEIQRLIINIPPRTMKSIAVTVAFPAWVLGRDPKKRIIAASYAAALSQKHSVDTRLLMSSGWYQRLFPGTIIVPDQNTKSKFVTTERGFRMATSVGGAVTGEGGDILIVDDPTNPMQADSELLREEANKWFSQTFTSRLNNKRTGAIIVVMQRLHQHDLTGVLLEQGGWTHLNIPLLHEGPPIAYELNRGKTLYVREEGDVLQASRFPPHTVEQLKKELGSYGFAGQFQQNPAPREGGLVNLAWFKRYKTPKNRYKQIVQSWDTASKEKELNDPSHCQTWGVHETGFDLLETYTARLEFPALKQKVKSLAAKEYNGQPVDVVLIEDASSGTAIIQDLRHETRLPIIPCSPGSDGKVVRMVAKSPTIEAGCCALPESAPWLHDFETSVSLFPNAAHDEEVDAMSQFLAWATKPRLVPRIRSL